MTFFKEKEEAVTFGQDEAFELPPLSPETLKALATPSIHEPFKFQPSSPPDLAAILQSSQVDPATLKFFTESRKFVDTVLSQIPQNNVILKDDILKEPLYNPGNPGKNNGFTMG